MILLKSSSLCCSRADWNMTLHFFSSPPQNRYLLETALLAVGGRSVCPTPRCSWRSWRGSTPPINSSPRTKGEGYPRRRTWQRDKWQSGFRTGAWRRRRSFINSRAPVSCGDPDQEVTCGHGCAFPPLPPPKKLCYNLLHMKVFLWRHCGSASFFFDPLLYFFTF